MIFSKKSIFGTSYEQISSITEAQGTGATATLFDKIIWMIKSWCNTTFALKSHNHSASQITNLSVGIGLPDWTKKKQMTGTSYTCPGDGWIFLQPVDKTWTKLNGITIAYAARDCGGDQTVFPVSKNDVVMLTNSNDGTSGYDFESRTRFGIRYFVPFK